MSARNSAPVFSGSKPVFGRASVNVDSALAATPGADAPTLSFARLANDGRIDLDTAALAIVIAAVATTVAKLGILVGVGSGPIVARVGTTLAGIALTGVVAIYLLF